MKTLFFVALLPLIISLSNQCSNTSIDSQNQNIDRVTFTNQDSIGSPSLNIESQNDQQLKAKISIQNLIGKNAALSRIPNLKDKELLNGETEIRILVGGGIGYPRWFILNNHSGTRRGFNVKPVSLKEKILMEKIELNSPKSGWEGFENYLTQQGIKFPLQLSPDKNRKPYFDGEVVVVEVKSGNDYDVVYYSDITDSNDGRKVIDVCQKIKQELGIDLVKDRILKLRK